MPSTIKEVARLRMRFLDCFRYIPPWVSSELDQIDEVFGGDLFQDVVETNRKMLEALANTMYDQTMLPETIMVDGVTCSRRCSRSELAS